MVGPKAESRIRRLKYHHAFEDRLGVVRHYFRRNGKRTPLRGPFGSAEFCSAETALQEQRGESPLGAPASGPVFHSPWWRGLNATDFAR